MECSSLHVSKSFTPVIIVHSTNTAPTTPNIADSTQPVTWSLLRTGTYMVLLGRQDTPKKKQTICNNGMHNMNSKGVRFLNCCKTQTVACLWINRVGSVIPIQTRLLNFGVELSTVYNMVCAIKIGQQLQRPIGKLYLYRLFRHSLTTIKRCVLPDRRGRRWRISRARSHETYPLTV